jgi:hypothetical protein
MHLPFYLGLKARRGLTDLQKVNRKKKYTGCIYRVREAQYQAGNYGP